LLIDDFAQRKRASCDSTANEPTGYHTQFFVAVIIAMALLSLASGRFARDTVKPQ